MTDEALADILAHLAEEARRLDRLLSDLLDVDRLRRGFVGATFRTTDVGELVERVVAETAPNGRSIRVQAEQAMAEVDAAKVERIVGNLIGNALKHTRPGTEIAVRVEDDGDAVLIAVDDHGRGVPVQERAAIFEIFNRGTRASEVSGAGVGLALVAQFAVLHSGTAWVEDNPNGGASFRVRLPKRHPTEVGHIDRSPRP